MNKWIKTAVAATATLTLALSAVGCSSPTPSPSATASASVAPSSSVATPTTTATEASVAPSVAPEVSPEVSASATGDTSSVDFSTVAGSWTTTTVIDGEGNSITFDDYLVANGMTQAEIDSTKTVTTLNEDGSAIVTVDELEVASSFTISGTTVTITMDSDTDASVSYEYDAEEDILSLEDNSTGVTIVSILQRVS